jgi:hypothetical protein
MMQTADLRERDDLAGTEWVYRAAVHTENVIRTGVTGPMG